MVHVQLSKGGHAAYVWVGKWQPDLVQAYGSVWFLSIFLGALNLTSFFLEMADSSITSTFQRRKMLLLFKSK